MIAKNGSLSSDCIFCLLDKHYETFETSYNGSTHKDLNEKVELKKNTHNKMEDKITSK